MYNHEFGAWLLRDTGQHEVARAVLAEAYNEFTEGFNTADLKSVKALLRELSQVGVLAVEH